MTKLDYVAAAYKAERVASDMHAAYWVHCTAGPNDAEYRVKSARESLADLAKIMGYTLVPIDAPVAMEAAE
jgi:hypothetical protein